MEIMRILLMIFTANGLFNFKAIQDPEPGKVIKHMTSLDSKKICFIGDTGKGGRNQEVVAKQLFKENCDQIRHLGDVIYNNGINNINDIDFKDKFIKPYKEIIDSKTPFFISVGNHDYKKNPSIWLDIANKYESIKFPSHYYADIYKDICFFTFDTNNLQSEQKKWFDKVNRFNDCKVKIATGHHPLYSSGMHGDAGVINQLFLRSTIKGKVDVYLAGHDHNLEDYGVVDGTRFIISGSGGATRSTDKSPGWIKGELGYVIFDIKYKSNKPLLDYTFYTIDKKDGQKRVAHKGKL